MERVIIFIYPHEEQVRYFVKHFKLSSLPPVGTTLHIRGYARIAEVERLEFSLEHEVWIIKARVYEEFEEMLNDLTKAGWDTREIPEPPDWNIDWSDIK